MGKRAEMVQFEMDCTENDIFKIITYRIQKLIDSRHNRKHRKISQEELAAGIEKELNGTFSRTTLNRKLKGGRRFTVPELIAISKELNCSLEYLCGTSAPKQEEIAEQYTGLSRDSVQYLHRLKPQERAVLNKLLSNDSGFTELIHALKDAATAQKEVDIAEKNNDGIERHINDNLQKEPPEFNPPTVESEMFFNEMTSELQRLESMLETNLNGITAESAAKDLVIRKFYNVLEKFAADITVKKWTMDYLNGIKARIYEYTNEMISRKYSALNSIKKEPPTSEKG